MEILASAAISHQASSLLLEYKVGEIPNVLNCFQKIDIIDTSFLGPRN